MDEIMTMEQRLQRFKEEFSALEDPFLQHTYLVGLSAFMPPLEEKEKIQAHLFAGCQSNVWLILSREGEKLRMAADGESHIIRGFLYLVKEVFDGQPLADIAEFDMTLFAKLPLELLLSSGRMGGAKKILEAVKSFAAAEPI